MALVLIFKKVCIRMKNRKKISIALVTLMMAMSPVVETLPNVNATVQAASHQVKKSKKKRAKVIKVKLWSVDFRNGKVKRVTAKKKAHKVIHVGDAVYTFNVLYYIPSDHKWEPTSVFKTKAKAKAAYKKALAEDREYQNQED